MLFSKGNKNRAWFQVRVKENNGWVGDSSIYVLVPSLTRKNKVNVREIQNYYIIWTEYGLPGTIT